MTVVVAACACAFLVGMLVGIRVGYSYGYSYSRRHAGTDPAERAKTAEQAVAMIATWSAGQDKDDSWLLHLDSACSNMKNPTKLALEGKCAGKQISWCKKCVRNRKTE